MQCKTKKNTQENTHKHKWIYAQWNGPSETKPNPENCKNCSSKCAYDSPLPSYLQTNIIAQMLSIGGEGVMERSQSKANSGYLDWRHELGQKAASLNNWHNVLLLHCIIGSYVFILYMMFHWIFKAMMMTFGYDTYMYAAFHKALQKYHWREVNHLDVILFQIYWGICEPIIILIYEGLAS